jgi:hypothetical protein
MSLWWLRYDRGGKLHGIAIIDASSLVAARMRAWLDGIDGGADFFEGHELDDKTSAAMPAHLTGRLLAPKQAAALLDRIDSAMKRHR